MECYNNFILFEANKFDSFSYKHVVFFKCFTLYLYSITQNYISSNDGGLALRNNVSDKLIKRALRPTPSTLYVKYVEWQPAIYGW